jgi:hypothetical protein
VIGATAVIRHATGSPWLVDLIKRKPPKLAGASTAKVAGPDDSRPGQADPGSLRRLDGNEGGLPLFLTIRA